MPIEHSLPYAAGVEERLISEITFNLQMEINMYKVSGQ
jgi:hypothetical protein